MNRHTDRERERRQEPRTQGAGVRARMRPGYRLSVIDLSIAGALVEAARPLRPGSHVDVQLESDTGQGVVAARVVRCAVASIHAERGITYRAALSFIRPCDWVREARTPEGNVVPGQGPGAFSLQSMEGEGLPDYGVGRSSPAARRSK